MPEFNDFWVFIKEVNYFFETGWILSEFAYCKKDKILTICFGTRELILHDANEKDRDKAKEICMIEVFKDV